MDHLKYVGKPLIRKDAARKVTGAAMFGADVNMPGQLYAAVCRSPYAHAKIIEIDTEEAKRVKGVRLILTGSEAGSRFGQFISDQPILAVGKVRFQGEPVAAVAAETLEAARIAAGKIRVGYEELAPVTGIDDAIKKDAVLVHEDWGAYKWSSAAKPVKDSNICDRFRLRAGDTEKAFLLADMVVENVYETAMLQHATMETHTATVLMDGEGMTVWTPAQSPFVTQEHLSELFGMPVNKVRVITTEVGGGFGNKYELRAEPIAAALALRMPGKPVKLTFERHEEFTSTGVRSPCRVHIKTGANSDGTLVAQETRVYWDAGAYVTTSPRVNYNAGYGACTPYKIPNMRIDGYCVMTNKQLGTAFRGFGASEIAWAYENQMDILAGRLGIDAVELRLKNLLDEGDTSPSGEVIKSVGTKDCLLAVAKSIGWAPGGACETMADGRLRGKGVACFSKITGTPSNSSVIIKLNSDSTVTVIQGGKEMGQGAETVLSQIVAESLGVPYESVRVAPVDTLLSPFEKTTTGSRLTFHAGRACIGAVEDMKAQIKAIASEFWDIDVDCVAVGDGMITETGRGGRSVRMRDIGKSGMLKEQKPVIGRYSLSTLDVYEKPDEKTGTSRRPTAMWFWGAQAADVAVDPKTGVVSILKMAAAHDVGKAINPDNCVRQIEGSVIMGAGTALAEEMIFDENARLLNGNLVDYKVPTSQDAGFPVEVTLVEKPHPEGPYGAKGIGEPGLVPTAAAIGNAVAAATGGRLYNLPVKPEQVLGLLR